MPLKSTVVGTIEVGLDSGGLNPSHRKEAQESGLRMSRRITDVANETEKDPWFPPLGVVWLQPASAVRPTMAENPESGR